MAERDQDLVQRTLSGQRQAFADLVERYSGLVHGIVLESIRRPEVVEDLVQEVFCEAYEKLASLRRPERFSSWLYSVAANRALDWLRLQQRQSASSPPVLSLAAPSRSPEELYEAREREEVVWAALDRLPPEQRRVAVLYYLEGCTHQEIARFLGLTAAMVKWRLRRARRTLKQELFVAHYQSSSERARTRQQVRNQVMAVLPLVASFEVGSAGHFLTRYGRRLALSLGLAGALGLAGLATQSLWLPLLTPPETGLEVIQGPAGRPTTPAVITLRWQPACPRAGQRVRIEASGMVVPEGGIAYLHTITGYRYPLDQVQPMVLQRGVWATQVEIPTAAANLFLCVSPEAAPQRFEEGLSAVQERKLQQYAWGLMVHDEQGRPCRGAEMGLAQMAILQGLPPEQGLAHLEREIARYPDNFEAYLMRWGTRFRSLPAAEGAVVKARSRAELAALEQQYPDRPELFYETASYAADSLA
ncbi:MAG: sigma-70 family RNA polymerase sigma factor, partial [Candidatus Latescibacterota bacterium]